MKRLLPMLCIFLFILIFVFVQGSSENSLFFPITLENKDNSQESLKQGNVQDPMLPLQPLPEQSTSFATTTTAPTVTTKVPSTTTENHSHQWELLSVTESTCTKEGFRILGCFCGAEAREVVAKKEHQANVATCKNASVCSLCQAQLSPALGHSFVNQNCKRCNEKLKSPIFVLGHEINFDESFSSLCEKLGNPTEIVTEGNINSLIYASDLTSFTVIQTDENGLWGVFTMDLNAVLLLDGDSISIGSFFGEKDLNSEAYFKDAGSCRVFGFKDAIGSGKCYGIWMRYSECRYDYISDVRLNETYWGQNRISYYYINALRVLNGLSPLIWSQEASQVATEYSDYMISQNIFQHDGSYGNRLKEKGIVWSAAGENISQGYYNAFFVCDAYYNSQDHRDNILRSSFTHVGTGYCLHTNLGTVYGAQIFYTESK